MREDTIRKTVAYVEEYANKYAMFEDTNVIVVGVSGGADSMCLLSILNQLKEKYQFVLKVVHIHHQIRGKDADEDMEYVEKCCKDWNLEFFGFRYPVEEIAKKEHLSCEEAGRMVRYRAFLEVLGQTSGKIAVAHNCDDNSETVLFHMFRGTGIKGLGGIVPKRDKIIRPILCLKRSEIEAYLQACKIVYRTDVTNQSDLYTRNKIRNRILPYVKQEINEKAAEHMLNMSEQVLELYDYVQEQTMLVFSETVQPEGTFCIVDCKKLRTYPNFLQKEVFREIFLYVAGQLKDVTAKHIEKLCQLMSAETGKEVHLPYQVRGRKEYDTVIIEKYKYSEKNKQNLQLKQTQVCKELSFLEFAEGKEYCIPLTEDGKEYLLFEKLSAKNVKIEEKLYTKWLDYDIIGNVCQFRTRQTGDYLVVNQMGGKKKLKDYFIDIKLLREKRDTTWLLANGAEIFWVVGGRISERCKVTDDTRTVLKISYVSDNC